MKNFKLKSLLPYGIALAVFAALTCLYFKPVFDGKVLRQGDINNYLGMSKEIMDFRAQYDQEPLWTNSMFGGMPAYQISVTHKSNLIQYVDRFLRMGLPHPFNMIFLIFLGFFILLLVLKIDPWLSILGAIAYGFSSYFFIVLEAGHNSQTNAIAYVAPVVAGVILTFRGRYLLGGALTALFLALDLLANHPQITYYLFLFLGVYASVELVNAIRTKSGMGYIKSIAVLVLAAFLAVGSNAGNLLPTYEYGKLSTRSKSDLTFDRENKTSGLDKDYATQWSYGIGETMSLLIPDFKGGGSGAIGANDREALKDVDNQYKEYIAKADPYWGDQPFTSGPVYVGAIIVFLFVLGLFIVEGPLKQALVIATIFSILLAWGKNLMGFSEFFLDHFPGYNKFRAVSMMLVISEFTMPLLAVLALDKLLKSRQKLDELIKLPLLSKPMTVRLVFLLSFALTGGLALVYYLFPGVLTDFFSSRESKDMLGQLTQAGFPPAAAQAFMDNLEIARKAIFRADAIRSFGLIALAAGCIWLYFKSKIERIYIVLTLAFFILVDMWSVDKRYVNNDNFIPKAKAAIPFPQTQADAFILGDKDPDFRVLNVAISTFNDASTSYRHKSIGGYHGAKMKRYQELVDFQIDKNISVIMNTLKAKPTDSSINAALSEQTVLNMLNTRYIIYNPDAAPIQNHFALGNAWFVNNIKMVPDADSEITALSSINPRFTAIVDQHFKSGLEGFSPQVSPDAASNGTSNGTSNGISNMTSTIKLTSYKANELTYESNSTAEKVAVFSEIYYKDGWNAYIDGKPSPHFRADYVLRAMRIPAGKHEVVYKFEPTVYKRGEGISLGMSALLLISVGIALYFDIRKKAV